MKSKMIFVGLCACVLITLSPAAIAPMVGTVPAPTGDVARFTIIPAGDKTIRLDTFTGQTWQLGAVPIDPQIKELTPMWQAIEEEDGNSATKLKAFIKAQAAAREAAFQTK